MTRLSEEHDVAKTWVEATFPEEPRGPHKAALILAFGAGLDRGIAEAEEIVNDMLAAIRAASNYSVKLESE